MAFETNLMAEMTWTEYHERVSAQNPFVMIPVGALEQHGPHLPMGTDHLVPLAISKAVANKISAIVAPPFNYGYKSQPRMGGGNHFCGTTSIDGHTLALLLRDVLLEFVRHGVKRIAVIDGHYENMMFLTEGIDLALREIRREGITGVRVVRLEYWDFTTEATLNKVFPDGFPGYALEHAAVMETSMSLHLHPHLVRIDKIPDEPAAEFPEFDVFPYDLSKIPPSGVLSPAKEASAEKGKLLFDEYVERISIALKSEMDRV